MPEFSYRGVTLEGLEEQGRLEASSENIAFETLTSRGITVIELYDSLLQSQTAKPWYLKEISFGRQELGYLEQAYYADLLATLLESGIPLSKAIALAARSTKDRKVANLLLRAQQRISEGAAPEDAFSFDHQLFSPIFLSFLRIGGTSNRLPKLLRNLALFFRNQGQTKQKITSALVYPTILLVASAVLFLFVSLYLAPNLEPIFLSFDKPPPPTVSFLLAVNQFLRESWVFLIFGVALVLGALLGFASSNAGRAQWNQRKFDIPVIGPVIAKSEISRLSMTTGLLIEAGYPLSTALRSATSEQSMETPITKVFTEAAEAIEAGSSAYGILSQSEFLPALFTQLFQIGEQTNTLVKTLAAATERLEKEYNTHISKLTAYLTPTLTLILGTGIGFLIYTLMGAILEVNEIAF